MSFAIPDTKLFDCVDCEEKREAIVKALLKEQVQELIKQLLHYNKSTILSESEEICQFGPN